MCIYTCVFAVQTPAFYETEHFLLQLVDHFHVFLLHFMFRFVFLFTIYLFFIDVVSNPFLLSLFARYIFSWLFSFISSHFQVGVCFLHARSFIKKNRKTFSLRIFTAYTQYSGKIYAKTRSISNESAGKSAQPEKEMRMIHSCGQSSALLNSVIKRFVFAVQNCTISSRYERRFMRCKQSTSFMVLSD